MQDSKTLCSRGDIVETIRYCEIMINGDWVGCLFRCRDRLYIRDEFNTFNNRFPGYINNAKLYLKLNGNIH